MNPGQTIGCQDGLSTEVHGHESVFETLGEEWRSACSRMQSPSVFITPEYLETAWKHLREADDQPWVMAVREAGQLVGLLPLVRSKRKAHGLTGYELRHMGMWEGDRPGLLTTVASDRVWPALFETLRRLRNQWQWLDLRELDDNAWPLRHADQLGPMMRMSIETDTQAAFLTLEGSWDDYLAGRSTRTRKGFLKTQRQLSQEHPGWDIQVIEEPAALVEAFDRYVAVERRGWKVSAGVGLWSDARQANFYRELLPLLARDRRASVWLLRIDGKDAAGLVRFSQGEIVYERLCTYDPDFAQYSPGVLLCREATRRAFGSNYRESDALGMAQPLDQRRAIASWYDGMRQTHRLAVTNLASPMALWLAGHYLFRRFGAKPAVEMAA
jgi:CelD/BcsL family acetyltransferase involved in cellulose biosynthesis